MPILRKRTFLFTVALAAAAFAARGLSLAVPLADTPSEEKTTSRLEISITAPDKTAFTQGEETTFLV